MIFPLEQVRGGISLIEDVPLAFLENARQHNGYSTDLFPIWFRKVVIKCTGVNDRFESLYNAFIKVKSRDQRLLIDTIRKAKYVSHTCNDITQQPIAKTDLSSTDLQTRINDAYRFLFEETLSTKAFKEATGMSLADHYEEFHTLNEVVTCPFCGLETYALPERRRADYDHYLSISEYPWLGVNFDNLVPMGDDCNGKKNATNLLYDAQGDKNTRRLVWHPYQHYNYTLTATVIQKPTLKQPKASWEVQMTSPDVGTQSRLDTWDSVFGVKKSIESAIARFHKRFIEDLCLKKNLYGAKLTTVKLRQELKDYGDNKVSEINLEPYAIAKKAWAAHYINRATEPELAPIINEISRLRKRPSPLSIK